MTISISIKLKATDQHDVEVPFSVQRVMEEQWRPFAREHGLPMIAKFEHLRITRLDAAELLLAELRRARTLLAEQQSLFNPQREYMLERLGLVIPALEEAIGRWDTVAEIVI
jgi:hypothetical protein